MKQNIEATTADNTEPTQSQPLTNDLQNLPSGFALELQSRAINAARDGIVIVDALAPDMPIIWANRGFLDLSGYPIGEILGNNCRFLQGESTDKDSVRRIREALQKKVHVQEDILNFKKDGTFFWNELSISPVCADPDSDNVTHFIGVQNDITERVRAQKDFEGERRLVEMLQRSLLMTTPNENFSDFSFGHVYQAHRAPQGTIGGDFFDYFLTSDDEVAMVIGDVQGKGLEAATQIAQVKYSLRALLREAPRPSQGLLRMNEILNEVGFYGVPKETRLVAAAIALINTRTGAGSVSVAGISAPLILRNQGGWEALEIGGTPLGSYKEAVYPISEFVLEPGDAIIMVTDGITEARRFNGEFFSIEDLAATLQQRVGSDFTAQEISDDVMRIGLEYTQSEFQDDVCILVGKRDN